MTDCDHGIRLDRYCSACEWRFHVLDREAEDQENRHRAGLLAAACLLVLIVIAAVAAGRNGS